MRNAWDLSVFTYAGRDSAPAPAPVDRGAAGRGVEPAPVDRPATGGVVTTAPVLGESGCTLTVPATVVTTTAATGPGVTLTVGGGEGIGEAVLDLIRNGRVQLRPSDSGPALADAVPLAGPADPVDQDAADPLGLTSDQRAASDLAADLPEPWVALTDATAPPVDDWNAVTAALTDPLDGWAELAATFAAPDQWADLTRSLITTAPATEDDAFARLREACIE